MNDSKNNNRHKPPAANSAAPIPTYLARLNPKQREAVEYGIKPEKTNEVGPLLVIAGAGSGKTKTLAHRVAHLIMGLRGIEWVNLGYEGARKLCIS